MSRHSFTCRVHAHLVHPLSLKRFGDGEAKESDWQWCDLFPKVERYLKLGSANSFELPWKNEIWNFALCRKTLKNAGHNYTTKVASLQDWFLD